MEILGVDAVWARIARAAAGAATASAARAMASDGDGTLWTGDVGEDLFHAFVERGEVTDVATEALRREARAHELSDGGSGAEVARRLYAAYFEGRYPERTMCEVMAWCFAGWTRAAVAQFARDTLATLGLEARLHREVSELIARARREGIEVFLVSASPVAIIEEAGRLAGFDPEHVVAARSVYEGDVMSAAVDPPIPYAEGKVERLRERLGPGTALCAALGDNAFDVALLSSAAVGIAVRPKTRLRDRAGEVPGLVELAPLP